MDANIGTLGFESWQSLHSNTEEYITNYSKKCKVLLVKYCSGFHWYLAFIPTKMAGIE